MPQAGPRSAGGTVGARGDEDSIRARNAEAPHIDGLWRRVAALFAPYRAGLILTAALVLTGAVAAVIPPLVLQRIFDNALFPADGEVQMPLLTRLVIITIVLYIVIAALGVWQTYVTSSVGDRK